MSIILKIPSDLEQTLRIAWGDGLDQAALEALVAEGYRQGKLGFAMVGRLLGHESRWQTEQWLCDRSIALNYTLDDLEADRAALAKLLNKSA